MGGNNEIFEIFERNKYLKKLPSMQRVKNVFEISVTTVNFTKVSIATLPPFTIQNVNWYLIFTHDSYKLPSQPRQFSRHWGLVTNISTLGDRQKHRYSICCKFCHRRTAISLRNSLGSRWWRLHVSTKTQKRPQKRWHV